MITISVLKITLFREIHSYYKCRPPTLSELTPIIFHMKLTHLGSEASKCDFIFSILKLIAMICHSF